MRNLIDIQNLQLNEQSYRCEINMLIDDCKGTGKNSRLC